jgi:hypothetical protein
MINKYVKYEDFVINKTNIISGNHITIQGRRDLDFKPNDPKVNKVHLLVITNQYVKYENGRTDGQTAGRTSQINISSFGRG